MTHQDLLKILSHDDNKSEVQFLDDCKRIQEIVKDHYGVTLTLVECQLAWLRYSAQQDAQWLGVGSCLESEITDAIMSWAKTFLPKEKQLI